MYYEFFFFRKELAHKISQLQFPFQRSYIPVFLGKEVEVEVED